MASSRGGWHPRPHLCREHARKSATRRPQIQLSWTAVKRYPLSLCVLLLAGLSPLMSVHADENAGAKPPLLLKKGVRVVVTGDSITEGMCYSRYIDLYLTACMPELEACVIHIGRSGATLGALSVWTPLLLKPYKPDLVTACFGMNDGAYAASTPTLVKGYSGALKRAIEALKDTGAAVIIGSPGAVDSYYFKDLRSPHTPGEEAAVYNKTLGDLRDAARDAAAASQVRFADIHSPMLSIMKQAKAERGEAYALCPDGIHPCPNGHLIMAYAFLKAMGVDGNIGTIAVDLNGAAEATEGHTVISSDKGVVQLESTRYPFCFNNDATLPASNRSILPFLPFNQELNRFMLVVRNLKREKATVTWGTASRSFTRKELESGVNLSDAFAGTNPFKDNFNKADAAVSAKELYETQIKSTFATVATLLNEPENQSRVETLFNLLFVDGIKKKDADIRAILAPVKHTLTILPE